VRGLTDVGGWKGRFSFSGSEFLAIRDQNHVFEDLIGTQNQTVLHDDGRSTRLFRGAYVTAVVIAVGFMACLLPARQATGVDQLLALRSE
jgi:hypothetical protein